MQSFHRRAREARVRHREDLIAAGGVISRARACRGERVMRAAVNEPQLGFVQGGCLFRLDNGLEWDRVVWTSGVPLRVRDGRGSWRLEVVVGFEVVPAGDNFIARTVQS